MNSWGLGPDFLCQSSTQLYWDRLEHTIAVTIPREILALQSSALLCLAIISASEMGGQHPGERGCSAEFYSGALCMEKLEGLGFTSLHLLCLLSHLLPFFHPFTYFLHWLCPPFLRGDQELSPPEQNFCFYAALCPVPWRCKARGDPLGTHCKARRAKPGEISCTAHWARVLQQKNLPMRSCFGEDWLLYCKIAWNWTDVYMPKDNQELGPWRWQRS